MTGAVSAGNSEGMTRHDPLPEWNDVARSLKRLPKDALAEMLAAAYEILPRTKIKEVFGEYVDFDALAGEARKSISAKRLLEAVQQFHEDSLARRYCQGFNVNSRNYRETSEGTRGWIKEVKKLFAQSVEVAEKGHHRHSREAMDLLFDLLRRIDDGQDFIFFADEAGSWQVGVEYEKIFPAYFAALAATASATDYADRVLELVMKYESYNRDKHLRSAWRAANREQRAALQDRAAVAPKKGRTA